MKLRGKDIPDMPSEGWSPLKVVTVQIDCNSERAVICYSTESVSLYWLRRENALWTSEDDGIIDSKTYTYVVDIRNRVRLKKKKKVSLRRR